MDDPTKTVKHDATVSHVIVISMLVFTALTSLILVGLF